MNQFPVSATTMAVARILGDGTRRRTQAFTHLQSHYLFRDRFGRPGKGNDKGKVEALVKTARRRFMVPIPKVHDLSVLNERLLARCLERLDALEAGGQAAALLADLEGLDHVQFLARLVELELIDRERRLVERRIKQAGSAHAFIKVTAKIVNRKFDKQMVPKNPGPGLLHQAPTFVPEIGPAIKQFSDPSVA